MKPKKGKPEPKKAPPKSNKHQQIDRFAEDIGAKAHIIAVNHGEGDIVSIVGRAGSVLDLLEKVVEHIVANTGVLAALAISQAITRATDAEIDTTPTAIRKKNK